VTTPKPTLRAQAEAEQPKPAPANGPRRNHVGTVSLSAAVIGAVACRAAMMLGHMDSVVWLQITAAGFEAAMVGGLADWFAVTALFRHPLGLPIPHTAIIPARRAKIIEGIVSMVEKEWLSPEVIGARLERIAPSDFIVDWLRDPRHVERLGAPVRDLLRGLARLLTQAEVVEFADRTIRHQLRELPIDASTGQWLLRMASSQSAGAAFDTIALSLANLARRPSTAENLYAWLDRSARYLRKEGKRLVALFLRRRVVQRKIVEAACDYSAAELLNAAHDPHHPLRTYVFGVVQRYAQRLADGDPDTIEQAERLRLAVIESLEASPLVMVLLARLRDQLDLDLGQRDGYLSRLVDRELRAGILDLLKQPERRAAFDNWVRTTANDLLRRHHNQIGLTVRENLEALETSTLVAQIEERVGADLQFIRLNGAVVGGMIGVLIALAHRLLS
jgi:uncharacterized membrane-anchored protein YjiN (DUF445 family)